MLDQLALGRRIQDRRKMKGMTQEQLGNRVGVSAQAVSKWETGESSPDIALLPTLCKALGASSDTLLGITTDFVPAICQRVLRTDVNSFRFDDVEVARADESVFIRVRFATAWDSGNVILFNPPNGTVYMLAQDHIIRPGENTVALEVRRELLTEGEATMKFYPGETDPPDGPCAYLCFHTSNLL